MHVVKYMLATSLNKAVTMGLSIFKNVVLAFSLKIVLSQHLVFYLHGNYYEFCRIINRPLKGEILLKKS